MANKSSIFSRLLILAIASLLVSVLVCSYKGEAWEEKFRTLLSAIKKDSIPDFAKEVVDEKGIPYVIYAEQNGINPGKKYNPTIVANYAIGYYEQVKSSNGPDAETRFKNCVDWLINNISNKDSFALYEFNWQQPWYPSVKAPYTSGMTSGRAIEVFTYAYKLYPSPKYLHYAKLLVRGFYLPIQTGGFTYKEPTGWWYEEIADRNLKTPKILDGHIFAVTGIHKYWQVTKSDSAKLVVQKGLQALKHNLPAYDAGNGWTFYDVYKKRSDKKYHRILTNQMKQVYELSNDPFFLNYYKKWNAYFEKPYLLRALQEGNRTSLLLFTCCFLLTSVVLYFLSWLYYKMKA